MKIAIASDDENTDGKVSDVCARAKYFHFFDNKEHTQTMKNPFAVGGGGAAFSVAQVMEEKEIEMFICAKMGGKMEQTLKERNITPKSVGAVNIKDALSQATD